MPDRSTHHETSEPTHDSTKLAKPQSTDDSARSVLHQLFDKPEDFLKVMKNNFDKVDADHNGRLSRQEVEHVVTSSSDPRLITASLLTDFHGNAIQGLAEEVKGHETLPDWNMRVNQGISRQDLDQAIRIENNDLMLDKLQRAILPELQFVGSVAGVTAGSFLTAASLPAVAPTAGFATLTGVFMAGATEGAIDTGNQWSEVDKVAAAFHKTISESF